MDALRLGMVAALVALAGVAPAGEQTEKENAKEMKTQGIMNVHVGEGGRADAMVIAADGSSHSIAVDEKSTAEKMWEELIAKAPAKANQMASMAEIEGTIETRHPGRGRPYQILTIKSYKLLDEAEMTLTGRIQAGGWEGKTPGMAAVLWVQRTPYQVKDDEAGQKLAKEAGSKTAKVTATVTVKNEVRRPIYWLAVKNFEIVTDDKGKGTR